MDSNLKVSPRLGIIANVQPYYLAYGTALGYYGYSNVSQGQFGLRRFDPNHR